MNNVVRTTILTLLAAGIVGAVVYRHLRVERSWLADLPVPLANQGVLPLLTSDLPEDLSPYREEMQNHEGQAAPWENRTPSHVISLLPGAHTNFYHHDPTSGLEIALLRRSAPGPAAYFFGWRENALAEWRPVTAPGSSRVSGIPTPVPSRSGRLILTGGGFPGHLVEIDFRHNTSKQLCAGQVLGLSPDRNHLAFTAHPTEPTYRSLRGDAMRDLFLWNLDAGHIVRIARLMDSDPSSGRSWSATWSDDSRVLFVRGNAARQGSFQWIYDTHTGRLQDITMTKVD